MAKRTICVLLSAIIVLASLTAFGIGLSQQAPRPLAPQADPGVDTVTTTDSKMMFNTNKVDVTFVSSVMNYGTASGTSVKVNITVNETGSTTPLFTDSQTIATLGLGPPSQVTFAKWSKTFNAEKTYVVNVTMVSNSGGNTNTLNDRKIAIFKIIDLHSIGPVSCQNLMMSKYLHTSSTENLQVAVQNYGTFDESSGMSLNVTIWDMTVPLTPVQLYSDEVSITGTINSQEQTMVMFSTPWFTPSTEPVPCRMNMTTKAAWDEDVSEDTKIVDFYVDNRYDASIIDLTLDAPFSFLLPGQNITINATLQNMGNMDLTDVNVSCTISYSTTTLYKSYSNFSSLSWPGSGPAVQAISFTPKWQVPDMGGTVNITVQCSNVQDEDITNDYRSKEMLINTDVKDIGIITTPTYAPSPITAPGDVTFNVTVTNFGNKALGTPYRFNASIYDSGWDLVAFSNATSSKTIAKDGVAYESFTWDMKKPSGGGWVSDGTYHFAAKVILVGDAVASNDERVLDLAVDYLHDAGIVNATDTLDGQSYTWNTTSPYRDLGVNLINNGPLSEDVTLNCTLAKAGSATPQTFNSSLTLAPGAPTPVKFPQHQFTEAGDYTLLYELLMAGDEAASNNTLWVNFTLTSLTPPNAVISSPLTGAEAPLGGKVYLDAHLSAATSPGATITSYKWESNRTGVISTGMRDNVTFSATGPVRISLTVTDSNGLTNINPAFADINVTTALTGSYTHYDLNMLYSYKSGSLVTPAAVNNTTPTVMPYGYLALGGYYDCSLGAAAGGRLYWLNVSMGLGNLDASALALSNKSTIAIMSYDTTWSSPPGEAGLSAQRAWFNLTQIGVDERTFSYHLGVFALPLPPQKATLTGRVTDNASKAIAGAKVSAFKGDLQAANATADPAGGYSMEMDIGVYQIKASAPGFDDWTLASFTLGQGGAELDIVLSPVTKASVGALVRDKTTKAAIGGASVKLIRSGTADVVGETATLSDGKFQFTGLDKGLYLVRINATAYDTLTTEVFQLQDGQSLALPEIELTKTNHKPVLSSPSYSPASGDVSDKYTFSVTYTDQDNDPPQANGVYVMVGDTKVILRSEAAAGGAVDYRAGVRFSAKDQSLDEGDYRVVFMASDARSLGADAVAAGNLTVGADTSSERPTNLLVVAAILIVVIVLIIIAMTIFLFRRKSKKDKEEIEKMIAPTEAKVSEIMCTGCGSTLPEGTQKCPKCGRDLKKVEAKASHTFKCPTCGAANPEGSTKCIVCKKDYTAVVHDTTKMADSPPPPAALPPEGAPSAEAQPPGGVQGEPQQPEGDGVKDLSKLSNEEFDDGMDFEGFDEA